MILPDSSLPVGASAVEESLSALGEVESCCGASALRSGSKRKSDEDGLIAGVGGDDDDKVDLVKVKKQCIEEAFREHGVLKKVGLISVEILQNVPLFLTGNFTVQIQHTTTNVGVPFPRGLGWLEFDFGPSAVSPILLRMMGIWQKRLGSWAS